MLVGFRLMKRYRRRLRLQFANITTAPHGYPGFQIRCRNECIVSQLRLGILIDNLPHIPSSVGLYLKLETIGSFEAMQIILPVEITFFMAMVHDGVSIKQSGKHSILLEDDLGNITAWSSPNLYIGGGG